PIHVPGAEKAGPAQQKADEDRRGCDLDQNAVVHAKSHAIFQEPPNARLCSFYHGERIREYGTPRSFSFAASSTPAARGDRPSRSAQRLIRGKKDLTPSGSKKPTMP